MDKIDISILIVNYNTKDFLFQCLDSIYQNLTHYSFEIIVIDNNSSDGSPDPIRKEFPQVILIENKANVGFAKANNQGIAISKGRYFLLLNPDTEVLLHSIDLIVEFMDKDSRAGVVGPKLLNTNRTIQESHHRFPSPNQEFMENTFLDNLLYPFIKWRRSKSSLVYNGAFEVDWVTGACLAIRREVVDDVGMFDDNFFLYYEEVDFCYRVKQMGWKVFFLLSAKIIHYGGQSTKRDLSLSLWEAYKSKYYFLKKCYPVEEVVSIRKNTMLGCRNRLWLWRMAYVLGFRKDEAKERIKAYNNILKIKKDTYIAIDTSPIYRSKAGVGSYTKNLIGELPKIEHNTPYLLFNLKEQFGIKNKETRNAILRFAGAVKHLWWEQFLLPLSLWFRDIDLFHSPAFICPFIKTCRTVITIHDMAYLLYPDKFVSTYRRYLKFWVPLSVRVADKIITDSACSKRDIVRLFGISEKKVEVVYLGKSRDFQPITDKSLIDDFREKYSLRRDFILYVGTLEPRKNITGLISAYRLFKDMSPHLNYALVIGGGKGWMYSDIFKLIEKLSLVDDVIFLGYVQDKELPTLYNAAKLFVYPSLYEGFGLPVLEAMACGIPVITSNTSSLPEIVADAGIMLDPLDINALAEAMYNVLMDDNLRNSLIEKGLKRAENFSWEKTAAMTMDIYREVLSESKG